MVVVVGGTLEWLQVHSGDIQRQTSTDAQILTYRLWEEDRSTRGSHSERPRPGWESNVGASC